MLESPDHFNGFNIIAAMAGGIAAFAVIPWKTMGIADMGLTLFLGVTFGLFIGPGIASIAFGSSFAQSMGTAGVIWLTSAMGHAIVPRLITMAKKRIGGGTE